MDILNLYAGYVPQDHKKAGFHVYQFKFICIVDWWIHVEAQISMDHSSVIHPRHAPATLREKFVILK